MNESIRKAVEVLRRGGLVAFPTETVYGLGADATHPAAVRRIFQAKGRPSTNPLIVHVADATIARRYAASWPTSADELTGRFWPGPLTLVVPKSDEICGEVSAGLQTVGLRAPDHPIALALLREFDGPVAAPSANRSNRVSPTTADHVRRELGDSVDLILDGGPCQVGIESTVLDLTRPTPIILRPGAITREQLEPILGRIDVFGGSVDPSHSAASPGQQPIHYSPAAPAYRFNTDQDAAVRQWIKINLSAPAAVLSLSSKLSDLLRLRTDVRIRPMPADAQAYARELYAALHEADALGMKAIFIEMPPIGPEWDAVRDRLLRATREL